MKKKKTLIISYRIIFMAISLIIISKLTILGDYNRHLYSNMDNLLTIYKMKIFYNSTMITIFSAGIIKFFLKNEFITNLFFNLLSSYGIIFFLKETRFNKIIYFLLLFPSFTIWSSYISKENIVVFSSGILMGNLLRIYNNQRIKNKFLFMISIYLLFIYKPQYFASIFIFIIYFFMQKKIKKRLRAIVYLIYIAISIITLYLLRDIIDNFLKTFYLHFYVNLETFRNKDIFLEKYGFYKNMIYGMFISIWGPNIKEAFRGVLQMFSFLESGILLLIVVWNILRKKNSFEKIFLFFNCVFWLFLAQYPFGVFNAGAAVRYRTNLYIIFLAFFYIFILKDPLLRKIRRKN